MSSGLSISDPDGYEELPDTTFADTTKVAAQGNTTNCVWCHKAMLVSEADKYNRCEFDSVYPFTEAGKAQSISDRGEIAIISVHLGILP
jgi:hypothetical protein